MRFRANTQGEREIYALSPKSANQIAQLLCQCLLCPPAQRCISGLNLPRWNGSWCLIMGPEDLLISHKLGLPVCLKTHHDSSWQLSVYYLTWAQGQMSNLGWKRIQRELRPLPITLSRARLEGFMWQEHCAESNLVELDPISTRSTSCHSDTGTGNGNSQGIGCIAMTIFTSPP